MSDFVSNLIARHTQTEGNVTPRVRGRFESERSHAGFAPHEPGAGTDWTEPNSLISRPNIQGQEADNQWVNKPGKADRESSPPVRSVASDPFSRPERDRATDPKPQPERVAQTATILPGNQLPNPPINRPKETMTEPVRQGRKGQELREDQRVMAVQPVFKNPNAFEKNGFNSRSGGLLGEPNRLPEFRQNKAENKAEQPSMSPAQPSINVTIGRIEVRAMPSPNSASTPANSAPKPQLSLDDYLKQRNKRPT